MNEFLIEFTNMMTEMNNELKNIIKTIDRINENQRKVLQSLDKAIGHKPK